LREYRSWQFPAGEAAAGCIEYNVVAAYEVRRRSGAVGGRQAMWRTGGNRQWHAAIVASLVLVSIGCRRRAEPVATPVVTTSTSVSLPVTDAAPLKANEAVAPA